MSATVTAAERRGWTAQDMADYFEPLSEFTAGMSHPERVAWLANELSLHGDDEDLTASKALAWEIIGAWEASEAVASVPPRPVFSGSGVEKLIGDLNARATERVG